MSYVECHNIRSYQDIKIVLIHMRSRTIPHSYAFLHFHHTLELYTHYLIAVCMRQFHLKFTVVKMRLVLKRVISHRNL